MFAFLGVLLHENNVTDNVRLIHFEIGSVLPIILRMYSSPKQPSISWTITLSTIIDLSSSWILLGEIGRLSASKTNCEGHLKLKSTRCCFPPQFSVTGTLLSLCPLSSLLSSSITLDAGSKNLHKQDPHGIRLN